MALREIYILFEIPLFFDSPCTFMCVEDGTTEEVMFWEGEPRGPSKLLYPDGSYEERSFNDGAKNGPAKMIGR